MTLSPSSSTNFSRTLPLTCRRQRLWKLQPRTTRISRFWNGGGTPLLRPASHASAHRTGPGSPLLRTLSQLLQSHQYPALGGGLLEVPLTQGDRVGKPAPDSPNASGIRSQQTLSAGICLDELGPRGRICPRCPSARRWRLGPPPPHRAPTSVAQGFTPSCRASVRKAGSCWRSRSR